MVGLMGTQDAWQQATQFYKETVMTSPKIKTCILAAVAAVLAAGTSAYADDSTAELQKTVNDLQSKVAALQASSAANGKEVAATIDAVLRDAEKRSQSMAAMTGGAGYDNGFFIKSGDFSLMPGIIFQFWNVTDYRQNTDGAKSDEIENGFEVHRVDLILQGTAFTKDLTYFFMWRSTSEDGGGLDLQDAFVTYMFSDAWGPRAGQFVENFTHEDWLSDGTQLAAERSLMDATIGGFTNRTQGVSVLFGITTRTTRSTLKSPTQMVQTRTTATIKATTPTTPAPSAALAALATMPLIGACMPALSISSRAVGPITAISPPWA